MIKIDTQVHVRIDGSFTCLKIRQLYKYEKVGKGDNILYFQGGDEYF